MTRIVGAMARALLVAMLVLTPALLLPEQAADTSHILLLIALLAGLLTFIEYSAHVPSILEFRDAAPLNRLRFASLFATVFLLAVLCRGDIAPTQTSEAITAVGTLVGQAMDLPFSPVRLFVLILPETADANRVDLVRTAAGLAYLVSLIAMIVFVLMTRVLGWPGHTRAFNVWVNLPLFDPTAGGDVLARLQRDARLNIALGFLLPFLIPVAVKMMAFLIDPISLNHPQTLIWTITAWAFLPASMIMRGLALYRVAEMIEEKRRRTYAAQNEDADGFQPV